MKKIPIGHILADISKQKNLSAVQLAKLLNKTRQQVYNDFRVVTLKDDSIEKYASVLGVSKEEIYQRWNTTDNSQEDFNGIDQLAEQIKLIESSMREMFAQQLAIKDRQIEGLQRTVDVLLGKSKCVTETTTKVIDFTASSLEGMRA